MIPHFNLTKIRGKLRAEEKAVAAGPRLVRVAPHVLDAPKAICPVVEHLEGKRLWKVIEVPFSMGISGRHKNYSPWWNRMKRVDVDLLVGVPPLTKHSNQYIPKGRPSNVYTTTMPYKLFEEMLKAMEDGSRFTDGGKLVPWFVGERESHYGPKWYPLRHVDGKGVKNVHQLNPQWMRILPTVGGSISELMKINPIYMGWRSTSEDGGQNVSVMLFTDYHLRHHTGRPS